MKLAKLYIAFIILCSTWTTLNAQTNFFEFGANNFRWTQGTDGSLFHKEISGSPGLEVPINSGSYSIFASSLWLGGQDPAGNLKITFRRFCQVGNENCMNKWGPLRLDGQVSDEFEVSSYNTIWFVTSQQIENHIDYTDCLNDPNCDELVNFPNYAVPDDFTTWPAEGGEGYAQNLAPYVDRNGNETYDPENGDHPAICGDFSSYTIWNDLGTEISLFDGFEIGLEVHTTVYGYNSIEGAEFNTLFVQHKLINRGSQTLEETYAGFWNNFDIGNPADDYFGTDVERSMFYAFNGDSFDEDSPSGIGYENDLPAMGVKVLSGVLADADGLDVAQNQPFYGNETSGYGDGILDNERLGLKSTIYSNNSLGPTATQAPLIAVEYYNYMFSRWRDNTPMTFSGQGYAPGDPNALNALYTFPADSDPLNVGTVGIDPNYETAGGWTEENEGNQGSDRRMIGSSGPFTFAPGDVQYIDLAYIFARESFDDEETVIETLQRFADDVEGMQCEPLPAIVLSTDRAEERKPLKVFPNPSSGSISFELNENAAQLTMIDITGKVVRQKILNSGLQRIDVSDLADGIYLIQVQADQSIYHGKVIVEK